MERYSLNLNDLRSLTVERIPKFAAVLADEVTAVMNVPRPYAIGAIFAISSVMCGNGWEVQWGSYSTRLHDFWMLMGDPSAGKSMAFDSLCAPLLKEQKALKTAYKTAMANYLSAMEEFKAAKRQRARGASKKAAGGDNEEELIEPVKPKEQSIYVTECTPERRWQLMGASPKGLMWNADELTRAIVDPFGKGRIAPDTNAQIECWNGKHFEKETITGGSVVCETPFLTVFCGIQPDRLADVLADTQYITSGWLGRWLCLWNDRPPRVPSLDEEMRTPRLNSRLMDEWAGVCGWLYDCTPQTLTLSKEAEDVYWRWQLITRQVMATSPDKALPLGKLHIHCQRLAAVAHLLECAHRRYLTTEIGEGVMRWACDACWYFYDSQLRVMEAVDYGAREAAPAGRRSKSVAVGDALKACGMRNADGSKMKVTEVAQKFGVSRMTAAKAMKAAEG